jgi:hypothetical protein
VKSALLRPVIVIREPSNAEAREKLHNVMLPTVPMYSGSEQTTGHEQAQRCPSAVESQSQPFGADSDKLAATSAPTPATRATEPADLFDLMADLGVM